MHELAIVYIYTTNDRLTQINLNSIKQNNKNIPIFSISKDDFRNIHYNFLGATPISDWHGWQLWWKCDNIFLYWYLQNQDFAKNYVLVEWDTYCNSTSIIDFFGEQIHHNTGILSCSVNNISDIPNDEWFKHQPQNIELLHNHYSDDIIYKISPMSCTTISNDCVRGILDSIKQIPELNNIYIETKLGTIAKSLGFDVKPYTQKYQIPFHKYISYHENICERTLKAISIEPQFKGIFHPVKRYDIYHKYFNSNIITLPKNIQIHKMIYGSNLDVTKNGIDIINKCSKITANNHLFGDPAPSCIKQLTIIYEENGQLHETTILENESINFV